MKIWFVEIGEPLPVENGVRLMRYGRFTEWLTAQGHTVTWFACTFSHMPKRHVAPAGEQTLANGVKLITLPAPGYNKYISIARFRHHTIFAKNLKPALEIEMKKSGMPDIIINPISTCETVKTVRDFAMLHDIPYVVDVRDNWPQDFVDRMPTILKPFARLTLEGSFRQAKTGYRDATALIGTTQHRVSYGCTLAGRTQELGRDTIFYIGYTKPALDADVLAEAKAWWEARGLRKEAKIFSYIGTLSTSSDMRAIIAATAALKSRGDIQVVLAGGGDRQKEWVALAQASGLSEHDILFPDWIKQAQITTLLEQSTGAFESYVPVAGISPSNKFFEYIAHGVPILSCCAQETGRLIDAHGIGLRHVHDDPFALTRNMATLADNPLQAKAMGQAALELFNSRFVQALLFKNMERHLETLIRKAA